MKNTNVLNKFYEINGLNLIIFLTFSEIEIKNIFPYNFFKFD